MDDLRASYATSGQVSSLWTVIGTLQKQLEEVTGRLNQVQAGSGASHPAAPVAPTEGKSAT